MEKDRIVGAAHKVGSSVKEAVGEPVGEPIDELNSDSQAEKAPDKVQNTLGGGKDALRHSLKGK